MNDTANTSGAFMRPTLADYLLVVEQRRLRIALLLHLGRLELGVIGVEAGEVVFAELPGSTGDVALALLAQMPGTRVVPEPWVRRPTNVQRPWREFVNAKELEASPGQAWRLDSVRAELDELDELDAEPVPDGARAPGEGEAALAYALAKLLDAAATDAYLREDHERAHELLTRREQLCPADLLCAANLERLHFRLLEDGIAAGVVEEASS